MTETAPILTVVEGTELPLYPVETATRLDSHYFYIWNRKRWRQCDFRRHAYADPEVGFFGRELFELSQEESPIGTLPLDVGALAFKLRMSDSQFRELCGREVTPLYGWYECVTDLGERRLMHDVVLEVVQEAIKGKAKNAVKNADERMRKRLGNIVGILKTKITGASRFAEGEEMVNQISDWIEVEYPGGSATVKRVKEALNALSMRT